MQIVNIIAVFSFLVGQLWVITIAWRQSRLLGMLSFIPLIALFYGLLNQEDAKVPFRIMALATIILLVNAFLLNMAANQVV